MGNRFHQLHAVSPVFPLFWLFLLPFCGLNLGSDHLKVKAPFSGTLFQLDYFRFCFDQRSNSFWHLYYSCSVSLSVLLFSHILLCLCHLCWWNCVCFLQWRQFLSHLFDGRGLWPRSELFTVEQEALVDYLCPFKSNTQSTKNRVEEIIFGPGFFCSCDLCFSM